MKVCSGFRLLSSPYINAVAQSGYFLGCSNLFTGLEYETELGNRNSSLVNQTEKLFLQELRLLSQYRATI